MRVISIAALVVIALVEYDASHKQRSDIALAYTTTIHIWGGIKCTNLIRY